MMQKKVLKNIIHYNDCWFRNCFYQQLVAVYGAFGIPADYVVCNYTIDIDFSDDNETLDIREHEILDEDEFSALTGICQKRVRFEDVCKQLCTAVRSGNPVILGADSFYLPTRTQYYNQKHAPHYLLVYGFDLKRKMFTVGENDGIAIFHFTEKEVPFDVIEQTYHSFEERFASPDSAVQLEIAKKCPLYLRADALNKLKKDFCERNYIQYVSFYRMLLEKSWTVEELSSWLEFAIKYTNFFRILMKQCSYMFGEPKKLNVLADIWHDALSSLEILKDAIRLGQPELMNSERNEKITEDMEEKLKMLNRLRAMSMRMVV